MHDKLYKYPNDKLCPETGVKIDGFADYFQIERWNKAVMKMFLLRQRRAERDFVSQEFRSNPINRRKCKLISAQSHMLEEVLT